MEAAAKRKRTLSDLPGIAIDEILSCLPIKQAVRTSTLSKEWRHRWESIPDLNLSKLYADEVSKVLDVHSSPVRLFKAVQKIDEAWPDNVIQGWIDTLALRSTSTLRTLTLDSRASFDIDPIAPISHYFTNLTYLELTCKPFLGPQFRGFPALRSLHLHDFPRCRNVVSRLISACPLLETLTIINADGRLYLNIVAPNLRRLVLSGFILLDLTITSAPILEMAIVQHCHRCGDSSSGVSIENCNLMKVFHGMASIKKLKLDNFFLMYLARGHVPDRIPINFDHLRMMSLEADFGDMSAVSVTLCLLRSAPNLQKLMIKGCRHSVTAIEMDDFWKAQEHIDLFDKLEIVSMTRIFFQNREIGFIRFLLAKARVLKIIMFRGVTKKESDSIMTKLLGLPRVSSQARIVFTR